MQRLWISAAAWTLLVLASPGILTPEGSAILAVLGLAVWSWAADLPVGERPKRAFLIEALTAGVGWGIILSWMAYVVPWAVVWTGIGMGLYLATGGWLLRLLRARGLPLVWAGPLAWMAAEMLHTMVPPPFGLPWMRLGHHAHATPWIVASARVWGLGGLGFVLAVFGAGLAGLVREAPRRRANAIGLGLILVLTLGAGLVTAPPDTKPGPDLLLVQPAIPQERKLASNPLDVFDELRLLTFRALAETDGAPPDLVAWGETMLKLPLVEPGTIEVAEAGIELPPWSPLVSGGTDPAERLRGWAELEANWVGEGIFGGGDPRAPKLPEGTSFLVGAEVFAPGKSGGIGRYNGVVLYDPQGERRGFAAKRALVPGAESDIGLSGISIMRDIAMEMGGYIPDFSAAEETGILELETRDGGSFRMAATVCFDNAFEAPFLEPAAAGGFDFHVVVSNEAWYEDSLELDQMVAFSRVLAVATGRPMVRVTNSGVSVVLAPDGSEVARLRVDGRDREVPGTLRVRVPVPENRAERTLYARSWRVWRFLFAAAPWLLLFLRPRPERNRPTDGE